ncbi:MAG: hypothetical protein F9K22_06455 [Bacteroidetes bacterium]|nr:MAG: hypothetical protein F9K22_06455 [Bacteroidota bacterium]
MRTLLLSMTLTAFAAGQGPDYDATALSAVVRQASFEFYNELLYRDEPAWKGRVISFSGYMVDRPAIGKGKSPYIQLMGNGVNGLISVIAQYDGKLPVKQVYGTDVPVVTTGQHLRFLAEIRTAENFLSVNGVWMYLPVVKLLAIYQQDDAELKRALWVSRELRR